MAEEKRENLAEADKGSYFNQEEWLEEFLDDKNEFYISTGAVTAGALYEKVFLRSSQISQEITCVGVSFY